MYLLFIAFAKVVPTVVCRTMIIGRLRIRTLAEYSGLNYNYDFKLKGWSAKFDVAKSYEKVQKWAYVRVGGYYLRRLIKYV